MNKKRVVITGMGVVSPLGCGIEESWKALVGGRSGIRALSRLAEFDLPCKVGGFIPEGDGPGELDISQWIEHKDQKRMDRFIMLAVVAAEMARKNARLSFKLRQGEEGFTDVDPHRAGVIIGAGIGGLPEIERTALVLHSQGARRVSPFFIPAALVNLAAGQVAIYSGAKGLNMAHTTACAASAHALGEAFFALQAGRADVIVAGGTESTLCPIGIAGFSALKALSVKHNDQPEKASRPWDKERDGFVMGEGASIFTLETWEHAQKRGATLYGEIVGYGASCDADHITAASGEGGYRSMVEALTVAGVRMQDIGYINAHGTSTPLGDLAELRAVERLIQDHKVLPKNYPLMSSTKSSTGHLLGASGALEAAFVVKALQNQLLPATLNLDHSEETFLDLIPHKPRSVEGCEYALSNSFGFGGTNASLVFKRVASS
jgi:3-oxoacyl-[acyl-carrier-protein] synthase II